MAYAFIAAIRFLSSPSTLTAGAETSENFWSLFFVAWRCLILLTVSST